jgi:ABC-type proline/glycine betaine transport system permease subunit
MTATDPGTRAILASAAPTLAVAEPRARRASTTRMLLTPLLLVLALAGLYLWVHTKTLDSIEQRTLNRHYLFTAVAQHLKITVLATILILIIAVPLGIVLSRPWSRVAAPFILALANLGQAFPAIGLLVLLTMKLDVGLKAALISFVAYGVLPVLRNTIVGLQQIDRNLIEAARGIGMRPWQVLARIELPLAVPVLLAGVRTTLVLTVGVATLATFVNAGGLGDIIVNGLKLNRFPVQITGAVLTMCVAFFVDWVARIAEDLFRPRGL